MTCKTKNIRKTFPIEDSAIQHLSPLLFYITRLIRGLEPERIIYLIDVLVDNLL